MLADIDANLKQLNNEVDAWAEGRTLEELDRLVRMVGLELLSRTVMKTPVDKGRARGGWQLTVDRPATGETGRTDKSGSSTIAAGQQLLATSNNLGLVFLSNNVPYIGELEEGHSQQAPHGMLALSVEEVLQVFS